MSSHPLPRRQGAFFSTPFGEDRTRFLARWLGSLFLLAGIVAGTSLLFPNAPYSNVPLAAVCSAIAVVAGAAFLLGTFNRAPFWFYRYVLVFGTLLAAVGTYAGGEPTSGAQFFFIWIVPYAFAFGTPLEMGIQAVLMATSYGIVLALQEHLHHGFAPAGLIIGMWVIVVCTEVVVGLFVRRLSRSLHEADQHFGLAFERSPIGAAFLQADLTWLEINPALCALLRRSRVELLGASILNIVHYEDRNLVRFMLTRSADEAVEFDARYERPDGTVLWATASSTLITPVVGSPYMFSQFRDITAHKKDREILAHQAIHDPLTGLFNRTLLLERLVSAMREPEAHGTVAVILLDLDQFKVVNDSLGHHVGDQLLGALAPRLLAAVEPSDTLARFGGDEFVVLCEQLRYPMEAVSRAGRIVTALSLPIMLGKSDYLINASVGVAVASQETEDAASLLRDADAAMYRAKASGRNRIELFDRSMREEAISRLEFEHDLRDALRNDKLSIVYQPVVNIDTGQPVMLEALVRWNHPTRGLLMPNDFIPFAEESGLIDDIGDYVLRKALRQLDVWQSVAPNDPPIALSVNVSGRQFDNDLFAAKVAELLRTTDVAPGSFAIELTESILLESQSAERSLAALKELGVVILLDDFGTGYSSLSYLERLPIDIVKIDKSFVARSQDGANATVVLEAIISITRALRIRVIAEGVEDGQHIVRLRELGCRLVQGNAVSPPLAVDKVLEFLEERRAVARAIEPTSGDS